MDWIRTDEQLPPTGEWVLVTTGRYQKPIDIMCYQGTRIGSHYIGNGWEDYEFPSWTSGNGDVRSEHPTHWMKLPDTPKEMQFFCP